MKRLILLLALAVLSVSATAQNDDTTLKFLGFPVDGSKQQMIENLKSKGFSYNSFDDCLTGQFNGEQVEVYVHTNHSIVDRVMVSFPSTSSKSEIKNRFNRLIRQFDDNGKYFSLGENKPITMDEDIAYEIAAHDKQYQAGYYYGSLEQTINQLCDLATSLLSDKEAATFVSVMNSLVRNPNEKTVDAYAQQIQVLTDAEWTPDKAEQLTQITKKMSAIKNSLVWFDIDKQGARYNINLFYDNRANMANGEDL